MPSRTLSCFSRATSLVLAIAVMGFAVTGCAPKEDKSAPAAATAGPTEAQARAAETVKALTGGEIPVEKFFEGPGGLIGVVLGHPGAGSKRVIAWTTSDGAYLVLGSVQSPTEGNITISAAQSMQADIPPGGNSRLPSPDGSYLLTATQVERLKKLPSFRQGEGQQHLWIIGDPLCPFCKRAHGLIDMPEFKSGLSVDWILTATVGGEQAAQLAADTIDTKITVEQAYEAPRAAGPVPVAAASPETMKAVADARALLYEIHPDPAVPAVIVERDGRYLVSTGFNPETFLPKKAAILQVNPEADIPVARHTQ